MFEIVLDWILYGLIGFDSSLKWVQSLHFFIKDSIEIILLLFLLIMVMGILRTYLPSEKIKKLMSKKKSILSNATASAFGAVTPFCSCSSIPLFISFLELGVPLGIAFSFLITSPLVNEYLVILMLGFFGWKITLVYVLSGMLLGTFAGWVLGKMKLNKHLVKDFISKKSKMKKEIQHNGFKTRLHFGINEASSIVKKLWIWILIGVGIGAIIHNYVPATLLQNLVSKGGIFAVPLAVLLGVPFYGSCAAIVPVAVVLFNKGISLGTVLAFMMSIAALSLPEAVILRRVLKLKLILIFFGTVSLGIIIIGYLFNLLF